MGNSAMDVARLVFENILYDEEGRQTGVGEEMEQVYADSTIISISQGSKSKLVNTTEGLKVPVFSVGQTKEKRAKNQRYRANYRDGLMPSLPCALGFGLCMPFAAP